MELGVSSDGFSQIMLIFLPMLKSNIESSVNKKKNPEFSLSERSPSRSFRVSGYPLHQFFC